MRTSAPVHELFLNYACNAKCPFCYNPPITEELLRRDLTFEQAARSLYAGAKAGARLVNLHGGEVTLRDDLPKILRLARKLGFRQATVVTNGVRLAHGDYARELLEAGASHFRLSIHGPDPSVHDPVLGIPGAFDKALAALHNLQGLGAPLGINFVIHRDNYRLLPESLRLFCLDWGVADVIVYFPHLRGMMALNADRSGVSYEETLPFVRGAFARLEAAGRSSSVLLANFVPCLLPELAGRMLDWEREEGAAATMTHPEGKTSDIHEMKDQQRRAVAACATCALGKRCRGVEREYLELFGEAVFAPLPAGASS